MRFLNVSLSKICPLLRDDHYVGFGTGLLVRLLIVWEEPTVDPLSSKAPSSPCASVDGARTITHSPLSRPGRVRTLSASPDPDSPLSRSTTNSPVTSFSLDSRSPNTPCQQLARRTRAASPFPRQQQNTALLTRSSKRGHPKT